jgi:hypothetical protein
MKKSLRTFILLVISNLYGDVASVIHANSAQISIQNHSISKQVATIKHRPMEKSSKNSWDSAIFFVIGGSKYFDEINSPSITPIIFINNTHAVWRILSHQIAENVAIMDMKSITNISCDTETHTESLQ